MTDICTDSPKATAYQLYLPSHHTLGGDPRNPLGHQLGLGQLHVTRQFGSTCTHFQQTHNSLLELVKQLQQSLAGGL